MSRGRLLALIVLVLALLLAGHALSEWLIADAGPALRAAASGLCALALWLAGNWLLSFVHLITKAGLWALAAAAIGFFVWRWRKLGGQREPEPMSQVVFRVVVLAPLGLWIAYVLWRGFVLPVSTHDALSYHLPKAVLIARSGAASYFASAPDPRIVSFPTNYELLLADSLVLAGNDRATAAVSTLLFVFLLVTAAAIAERMSERGLPAIATVLAVASAPIVILHAGAHKNDLLCGALIAQAALWGGIWAARGGRGPATLAIVATACAIGTKFQGMLLGPAMLLVLAACFLRRRREAQPVRAMEIAWLAGGSALAFLLLGGTSYLQNLSHTGSPFGDPLPAGAGLGYGDWGNLWRFPWLVALVPFSPRGDQVWVAWKHEYWMWSKYGLFHSHFGALFTILAVLVPLGAWRYRKSASPERRWITAALLLTFAAVLPIKLRPLGSWNAFPRYTLFVLPVVAGWTLAPVCAELWARSRLLARVLTCGIAIVLVIQVLDYGRHDAFAPLSYVQHILEHPEQRRPLAGPLRSEVVIDAMAGPNDVVAIDGAFDSWIYPAYGRELSRKVEFAIAPDTQWVAIDRSWNIRWGDPRLTDMSQFAHYFGSGKPSADDVRLLHALEHDPHWVRVWADPTINQAVFRRR